MVVFLFSIPLRDTYQFVYGRNDMSGESVIMGVWKEQHWLGVDLQLELVNKEIEAHYITLYFFICLKISFIVLSFKK